MEWLGESEEQLTTITLFNCFSLAMGEKKHNLASDVLKLALCAAGNAPVATNTKLSDLTVISYTNLSDLALTTTSFTLASNISKLVIADKVLTASGAVAAFRYAVIYNDMATDKDLIGWYDLGAPVTMANSGDTYTLDFSETNGVLQGAV